MPRKREILIEEANLSPKWEIPQVEAVAVDETVIVQLLNTDIYNGHYLALEMQSKQAYFIPVESAQYTVKPQEISKRVIDGASPPYDWSSEIAQLLVTPDDVRVALWQSGLVYEQSLNIRELVARLLRRGVLPIVTQEKNNA